MVSLEPRTVERTWMAEGIPVLTAEATLPQPERAGDALSRRLGRYYRLQQRAFLRYCEKVLLPQAQAEYQAALSASGPLPLLRAELQYRVTYQDERFLSLYTQSRESGGGMPAYLIRRGDTWDAAAGYPAPLSRFLPARRGWKRLLLERIGAEIRRQERAGLSRYDAHWPQALRRTFNSRNFFLTEEGLALFFPMYAIGPAAEGIPTFLVPWEELRDPPRRPEKR